VQDGESVYLICFDNLTSQMRYSSVFLAIFCIILIL